MKSVANLIYYLHKFSWNFSQLIPNCFELFSSQSIFNLKNRCRGVPPVSLSLSATSPPVSTPFPHGCYAPAPAPHHKGVSRHCLSAVRAAPPPHCRSASQPRMSERRRLCCPSAPHRRVAPHSSTGKAITPPLPPLHRTATSYSEASCRPSPPSPCLCRSSPREATPSSELRSPPPS
jgi:hypothetical protein